MVEYLEPTVFKYELFLLRKSSKKHREPNEEERHFHIQDEDLSSLLRLFEDGEFERILCDEQMGAVWQDGIEDQEVEEIDSVLKDTVYSYLSNTLKTGVGQLIVLMQGIVALQLAVQSNWTGPPCQRSAIEILNFLFGDAVVNFLHSRGKTLHEHAVSVLAVEESFHTKMHNPEYLWLARLLLTSCCDYLVCCKSRYWWAFRCLLIHQQTMDDKSPVLREAALQFIQHALTVEPLMTDGKYVDLQIQFHLEASTACDDYYEMSKAKEHARTAQKLAGLSVNLTGALGKRTFHQQEDKAQLVLQIEVANDVPPAELTEDIDITNLPKYEYNPKQADWSREMRGQRLQSCANLENWVLVCTQRDVSKAEDFLQNLSRVGPPMGIQVRKPKMMGIPDDKTNTFIRALREVLNDRLQLVVVIVPNNRKDRYDAIKKLCCLDFPVASQVIVGRTLAKKQMLMSVATKIAIQLNCKLGGEAWCLEIPLQNFMVVGYDSYHDSAQKGRSVGGVVCSLNKTLTSYHSRVTFQSTQQEMIDAFATNFTAALKRYHERNNALPERIIFYRDGVGDGQLPKVVEWELPQITQCFKNLGPSYQPKFAFVVVTKRLNTKFFAQAGNRCDNPPPGTVVDTEVTRPERYDFFLVSQSVRQGTVAPTQYNVIYDSSSLKPDHIQRLTYKLTHLYYNWPGTIRVPAPCQYAHKLAFLVGQSLHKDPHLDLADTLYYL